MRFFALTSLLRADCFLDGGLEVRFAGVGGVEANEGVDDLALGADHELGGKNGDAIFFSSDIQATGGGIDGELQVAIRPCAEGSQA